MDSSILVPCASCVPSSSSEVTERLVESRVKFDETVRDMPLEDQAFYKHVRHTQSPLLPKHIHLSLSLFIAILFLHCRPIILRCFQLSTNQEGMYMCVCVVDFV